MDTCSGVTLGGIIRIPTDKLAHFAWSYILVHTPATIWGCVWVWAIVSLLIGLAKEIWDYNSKLSTVDSMNAKECSLFVDKLQDDATYDLIADLTGIAVGLGVYYLTDILGGR